jgi:signal transduction histidine kinase
MTVVVCAVIPLAAVGAWLTSTASRSGALLLRSQLDTVADRLAAAAAERWVHRRSDALLLASNEPLRVALRASKRDSVPPAYLVRAFASTPSITAVVVRDASGRAVWSLGGGPAPRTGNPGLDPLGLSSAPQLAVQIPVTDEPTPVALGEVTAFVRLEGLIDAAGPSRDAVSELVAVHDRVGGGWLRPRTLMAAALTADRFSWQDRQWLAVRRVLDSPPVDIVVAGRLDPFVKPFAKTGRAGAAALAMVALAVVVLTIVMSGRITESLVRLGEAADAVALGRFDTRVAEDSGDEVGRVGRAFNMMADSVRRMMHELSQREAVAAMGELAATVAHQIRSPATAIRLDVQRARDKVAEGSDARVLLSRALEQIDRLERAIAGSLRVARNGGSEFRELDLRDPLRRAIAGVQRECDLRDTRIDASGIPNVIVPLRGDDSSLEQLFTNVLMNAVQATSSGGRVAVAVQRNGERSTVRIHDNGCGMSSDVLDRAHDSVFSTKPGGTGLGLVIARRIAAAHAGELVIESEPSVGTSVTIRL